MLQQITTNFAERLTKLADEKQQNSLSTKLREKRFSLFKSFIEKDCSNSHSRLKIIDVGGTPTIWEKNLPFKDKPLSNLDVEVTVVNIKKFQSKLLQLTTLICDAKDMKQFPDRAFDVVFSNSLIEHVGDYEAQLTVADEIMRIGKKYFVQTPNFYFPVEPHFVFPCFQFLPLRVKLWLVTNFALGWRKKATNTNQAMQLVNSINLLRKQQLIELFPGATIFEEKFWGLTKSFIVYGESNTLPLSQVSLIKSI